MNTKTIHFTSLGEVAKKASLPQYVGEIEATCNVNDFFVNLADQLDVSWGDAHYTLIPKSWIMPVISDMIIEAHKECENDYHKFLCRLRNHLIQDVHDYIDLEN